MPLHSADVTAHLASLAMDLNGQPDVQSTQLRIVQLAVKTFGAVAADIRRTRPGRADTLLVSTDDAISTATLKHGQLMGGNRAELPARSGVESIVTVKLSDGSTDYGWLKIFSARPTWTPEAHTLAVAFGMHSSLALQRATLTQTVANLTEALESNRIIAMASGILMATSKLTAAQGFDRLSRMSQDTNRRLRDVAELVMLMGRMPTPSELGVRVKAHTDVLR